jgi:hypothetical protein
MDLAAQETGEPDLLDFGLLGCAKPSRTAVGQADDAGVYSGVTTAADHGGAGATRSRPSGLKALHRRPRTDQFQHEYLCIPISRWALFDLQAGKVAGGS